MQCVYAVAILLWSAALVAQGQVPHADDPLLVYGRYKFFDNGYGFVDRKGDWVIRPDFSEAGAFSEGYARAQLEQTENAGVIGRDGKWVLRPSAFNIVGDVHGGIMRASIGTNDETRFGFVDLKGTWVISPQYRSLDDFRDGLAVAQLSSKRWGAIDREGRTRIPFEYDYLEGPFNGMIRFVVREKRTVGYLDKAGRIAIAPFLSAGWGFADGVAAAQLNGKWGVIDKTGHWIVEARFDAVGSAECGWRAFAEGLVPIGSISDGEKKLGFINAKGKWVITPRFVDASSSSSGYAPVAVMSVAGKKWGIVDRSGKQVIEPKYESIYVKNTKSGPVFWAHDEPWPGGYNYYIGVDGKVFWTDNARDSKTPK